jgi:hypothetical protein
LAVSLGAVAAIAQEVVTVQLPEGSQATGYLCVDVDGDGLRDVAIASRDRDLKRRYLQVHAAQTASPRLRGEPVAPPYAAEADVIAFAFADVDAAAGRELVVCTAEKVVAALRTADGSFEYRPIADVRLLWSAADRSRLLPLRDACVDADGDGRDDLLLPEPDGAVLLMSAGGAEGARRVELALPTWRNPITSGDGGSQFLVNRLKLEFRSPDAEGEGRRRSGGMMLESAARAPVATLLDIDGDGKSELVAMRNGALWSASVRGAAAPPPIRVPMPTDRLKLFDPSADVQAGDFDGDGRLDLLVTSSASRNDEIEVRMDYYRGRDDGLFGKADSRLRTQAHARPPQLVDVDGDGKLDLVAMTLRVDALRALTGGDDVTLEVQCNVFRGTGERFVQPAMLARVLRVPSKRERGGGAFLHVLPGDRDGRAALLHRDGDELCLETFEGDAGSLRFGATKVTQKLPAECRLELLDEATGLVAVASAGQVLLVRMR